MYEIIKDYFSAFIPLFVAMDALGILPVFISLTAGVGESSKKKLVSEATLAALIICAVFIVAGKFIFSFLGINENDFRIGGGIVLLILAIVDLLFSQQEERRSGESVGIVPIGIPLIVGPAALTTILISVDSFGYWITIASVLTNLAFVWLVFSQSKWVVKIMGKSGSQAFAKVASLFLTGIAVMMIRVGITNIIQNS